MSYLIIIIKHCLLIILITCKYYYHVGYDTGEHLIRKYNSFDLAINSQIGPLSYDRMFIGHVSNIKPKKRKSDNTK